MSQSKLSPIKRMLSDMFASHAQVFPFIVVVGIALGVLDNLATLSLLGVLVTSLSYIVLLTAVAAIIYMMTR